MDSSDAQTPSNELSERPAEVYTPANQRASNVTSFWRTRDHLLYPYYGTFLYKLKSPHKYFNTNQTIAYLGLSDSEFYYLYNGTNPLSLR